MEIPTRLRKVALPNFDAASDTPEARRLFTRLGVGLSSIWIITFIISAVFGRTSALEFGLHPYAYYAHAKFLIPLHLLTYSLLHEGLLHLAVDLVLLWALIGFYPYILPPAAFVRAYSLGLLAGGLGFLLILTADISSPQLVNNFVITGAQPALCSAWWSFLAMRAAARVVRAVGRGYTILLIALAIFISGILGIVATVHPDPVLLALSLGLMALIFVVPFYPAVALLKLGEKEPGCLLILLVSFAMPISWAYAFFSLIGEDGRVGEFHDVWFGVNFLLGPPVGVVYGVIEGLRRHDGVADE